VDHVLLATGYQGDIGRSDFVRERVTGAPLLADALAWIECRIRAEYPQDHTIFVRDVVAPDEGEPGPALVYREHGYVRI
jgi:flavin reductase (DIM6/NTAB) family NADH-FMN oxidoreductase RutF